MAERMAVCPLRYLVGLGPSKRVQSFAPSEAITLRTSVARTNSRSSLLPSRSRPVSPAFYRYSSPCDRADGISCGTLVPFDPCTETLLTRDRQARSLKTRRESRHKRRASENTGVLYAQAPAAGGEHSAEWRSAGPPSCEWHASLSSWRTPGRVVSDAMNPARTRGLLRGRSYNAGQLAGRMPA